MGLCLSSLGVSVVSLWLAVFPGQYSEAWLCDLWAGARCHAARCEADLSACEAALQHCAGASHRRIVAEEEARPLAECARQLLQATCETRLTEGCVGFMQQPQP